MITDANLSIILFINLNFTDIDQDIQFTDNKQVCQLKQIDNIVVSDQHYLTVHS